VTEPPDAPPPGYGPPPGWVPPPPSAGRSDDGVWSVLSHLSFFVFAIFAPLIIMMTVGKTSPYVRHHAVEALNFHITFCLAMLVSGILILVFIGIPMLFAVGITGVVFTILAAVAAGRGEWYRYPISWRLVH
jgi:uncharacterized Tic20 family protein